METNTRKVNKCLDCGWIWVQRTQRSYRCPKCHSFEWDKDQNSKNKFLSDLENEKNQTKKEDNLKETKNTKRKKELTPEEIKQIKEIVKQIMELI
jgi:predicted RNA-binding Zn-ribbon protein involved in translation (DUF1610 family)